MSLSLFTEYPFLCFHLKTAFKFNVLIFITLSISFVAHSTINIDIESIFYFTLLIAALMFKLVDASDFLFDYKKSIKSLYRSNAKLLFYS